LVPMGYPLRILRRLRSLDDSDTDKSGRSHKWGLQDAEAPKRIRVGNASTE